MHGCSLAQVIGFKLAFRFFPGAGRIAISHAKFSMTASFVSPQSSEVGVSPLCEWIHEAVPVGGVTGAGKGLPCSQTKLPCHVPFPLLTGWAPTVLRRSQLGLSTVFMLPKLHLPTQVSCPCLSWPCLPEAQWRTYTASCAERALLFTLCLLLEKKSGWVQ